MKQLNRGRRKLLMTGVAGAIAQCLPRPGLAQSQHRIRQEWQQFKVGSHYASFLKGIAAMRQNTNPSDRKSLQYWANVHVNFCPHGAPYFIAWHRGYLHYFEQELRLASGDPELNVPYWDYYSYPTIPAEFTDSTPGNPLYRPRMGTNIHGALDLLPFAPDVYNFQHGTPNAFEPKLENVHNSVHNLIGGLMATMQSPLDPIFYLHHANIDRLTHAWALPDGKGIPLSAHPYSSTNSDPYWAGNHDYATDLSMERWWTLIPTWLGNDYASNNVPNTLPAPYTTAARNGTGNTAATTQAASSKRPPLRAFAPVARRRISDTRRVLGGAAQFAFDERSGSIRLGLDPVDAAELALIASGTSAVVDAARQQALAAKLVIDRALLTGLAKDGGYFYALYLNMPDTFASHAERARFLIGSLGPFQIAGASHHGPARLEFDISELLTRQRPKDLSTLTLSWVRIDGDNPPAGRTIIVDEFRIEMAYEPIVPRVPSLTKPPGWYGRRR